MTASPRWPERYVGTVSVVIPTYNRGALLGEALESVLAQGSAIGEIIVVDDGSTDDTPSVLAGYCGQHSIVRVVRQPNSGESRARNAGIRLAVGEFVAFLDSDDAWLPEKLSRQLPLFDDPRIGLAFTAYYRCSEDKTELMSLSEWKIDWRFAIEQLLIGCCIDTSTVVVRREQLSRIGLFDEGLKVCEDWDLWLRFATADVGIAYLPQPLTLYRDHPGSASRDVAEFNRGSELVFERLFRSDRLPTMFLAQSHSHLSRCYLNSAVRSLAAGDGAATRRALWRAFVRHPLSLSPGWVRMYVSSLWMPKPSRG